jgi:hypothetical protein
VVQSAILLGVVVTLGLLAAKRTGLGAPLLERRLARAAVGAQVRSVAVAGIALGAAAAVVIAVLDLVVFAPRVALPEAAVRPPAWEGLLASLYGGVTEELLMRLGLFSILAWLLSRSLRLPSGERPGAHLWGKAVSLQRGDDASRADSRPPADLADGLLRLRLEDVKARLVAGEECCSHVVDRRAFARELLGGRASMASCRASVLHARSRDKRLDEVRRHAATRRAPDRSRPGMGCRPAP